MRPRLLIGRGLRVLVWLGSTKMSAARVHLRSVVDALAKWEKLADKRLAHEANPISAALGAAVALGGLVALDLGLPIDDSFLIGSFGALATLLFAAPAAPLGRVRNTLGGHLLSCLIAVAIRGPVVGESEVVPSSVQKVLVPALSIGMMKAAGVVRQQQTAPHHVISTSINSRP